MPRFAPPRRLAIGLLGFVSLAASARGEDPTPSMVAGDRKPSFAVEPAAEAFVRKYGRVELTKDEVFVRALEELARSDLPPAAKADAFALMQRAIGWLFTGATRVFPGTSYPQTQAMILSSYFQYGQKLPEGLDVGPLLELARAERARHPLRPSNALLLATIINRKAAHDAVARAVDWKAVEACPVPAIDLHNLALAAALTGDPRVVADLLALLPKVESEESQEDLIAATGIFADVRLRDPIEAFARAQFPAKFDNAVQTALIALIHLGDEAHFRAFYKKLGDDAHDEAAIDRLRKFWDDGFRTPFQADPSKSALKIWDGFTFSIDKDGGWISFGKDYRCWISFL